MWSIGWTIGWTQALSQLKTKSDFCGELRDGVRVIVSLISDFVLCQVMGGGRATDDDGTSKVKSGA